jgi:hypothetical protein
VVITMQGRPDIFHNQKIKSLFSLIITIIVIHFIDQTFITLTILLALWFFIFCPWNKAEIIIFIIASVFFLGQNYAVLKADGFSFKHKDLLLMPYYEPFLWGFYYLNIKRFISEGAEAVTFDKKSVFGLFLTALAFSIFSKNSNALFMATLLSTGVLFIMFHERFDFYYGAYALALGFVIELFGVSTELWAYPEPDFLGIPYWFATMWISVGILGRRFLIPLAEWITIKFPARTLPPSY